MVAVAWAASARVAYKKLEDGTSEKAFYESKIRTADFYFAKLLPRTTTLYETMMAGAETLMSIEEDQFVF